MAAGKVIIVNPDMFGKDPDSKTTKANEVAKSFGLSDAASTAWFHKFQRFQV